MSAPWDLFDDDESSGPEPVVTSAAPSSLPASSLPLEIQSHLASILAAFVARHSAGATEDLSHTGGAALAQHIGTLCTGTLRLHALLRRSTATPAPAPEPSSALPQCWAQVGAASRAAAQLAWAQLRSPASWPHVCWREAYCMAQLGLCVHAACALGEAQGAMAALDAALILGAPRAEFEGLAECIEANALASAPPPPTPPPAPLPSFPSPTTPLPTALPVPTTTPGQWLPRRLVDSAPPSSSAGASAAGRLSQAAFAQQHVQASQPVVLQGLLGHWPALERWRHLDYWAAAVGHRTVPVERGVAQLGSGSSSSSSSGAWREELCLFKDFLAGEVAQSLRHCFGAGAAALPQPPVAYMAQHALFSQCPALRAKGDYDIPSFLLGEGLIEEDSSGSGSSSSGVVSNLWMGTAGTVTHAHFDSYQNVLAQVAGYKFVRLFPPSAAGRMRPGGGGSSEGGTGAQGNVATVDVEAPSFDASGCLDAVLGPGEAIFIPIGWYHYVRACTTSISLNMWWES